MRVARGKGLGLGGCARSGEGQLRRHAFCCGCDGLEIARFGEREPNGRIGGGQSDGHAQIALGDVERVIALSASGQGHGPREGSLAALSGQSAIDFDAARRRQDQSQRRDCDRQDAVGVLVS